MLSKVTWFSLFFCPSPLFLFFSPLFLFMNLPHYVENACDGETNIQTAHPKRKCNRPLTKQSHSSSAAEDQGAVYQVPGSSLAMGTIFTSFFVAFTYTGGSRKGLKVLENTVLEHTKTI
jgi:hypothetical protein